MDKKNITYKRSYKNDDLSCNNINNINLNYKQLNTLLVLNHKVIDNLEIGIGINFRYYYDAVLHIEVSDENFMNPKPQTIHYSNTRLNYDWIISASYNLKNIIFNINYAQSFRKMPFLNYDFETHYNYRMTHKLIDISIGYRFKIFDKKNRNTVNCPKM